MDVMKKPGVGIIDIGALTFVVTYDNMSDVRK